MGIGDKLNDCVFDMLSFICMLLCVMLCAMISVSLICVVWLWLWCPNILGVCVRCVDVCVGVCMSCGISAGSAHS